MELVAVTIDQAADAAGDAQASDRVEHSDETDAHQPRAGQQQFVLGSAGGLLPLLHLPQARGLRIAVPSEDCLRRQLRFTDDPALGDHSGQAARGEGAAAVADEMDSVVIGVVVRRDEAVGLANVVVQTRAEDAALQAIEGARSDALDVADLLRHSPDATRHSRIDLRDVRMSVGVAPRSVEEHSDVHQAAPPSVSRARGQLSARLPGPARHQSANLAQRHGERRQIRAVVGGDVTEDGETPADRRLVVRRSHRRISSSLSCAVATDLQHLGGQRGPDGVEVVAERGTGQGLPPVVAGQPQDALAQPVELQVLIEGEVDGGHLLQVATGRGGHVDDVQRGEERRQRGHPAGERLRDAVRGEAGDRAGERLVRLLRARRAAAGSRRPAAGRPARSARRCCGCPAADDGSGAASGSRVRPASAPRAGAGSGRPSRRRPATRSRPAAPPARRSPSWRCARGRCAGRGGRSPRPGGTRTCCRRG